jgi:septal ring factor EnvC (AmiA/AmiB activator)
MDSEKMFELAEQLKELRESKKNTEQELKVINADIESSEQQLAALMIDSETQNFTRNGVMFCLASTVRASAAAGRKDELFEHLGSRDMVILYMKPSMPIRFLLL